MLENGRKSAARRFVALAKAEASPHSAAMSSVAMTSAAKSGASPRPVIVWLQLTAAMVFAMAVIGAITRLTESGLSMVEWRPLVGTLPPLTEADWQKMFAAYRQTPEFQKLNAWMSLDDFKGIFWWEYVHRLWGRLIGLVFALPLAWFWVRGSLPGWLKPWLLLALLLGALQGAVGWWMVASGLVDDPHVSHWRLAAHLGLAVLVYGLVLALAERLQPVVRAETPRWLTRLSVVLASLIFLLILSGALVAGLDAGLVYNTFPTMATGGSPTRSTSWMEPRASSRRRPPCSSCIAGSPSRSRSPSSCSGWWHVACRWRPPSARRSTCWPVWRLCRLVSVS